MRNRTTSELTDGTSLDQVRENEAAFFKCHPLLSQLAKVVVGGGGHDPRVRLRRCLTDQASLAHKYEGGLIKFTYDDKTDRQLC